MSQVTFVEITLRREIYREKVTLESKCPLIYAWFVEIRAMPPWRVRRML